MEDVQLSSTTRATVESFYGFCVPESYLKLLDRVQDADGSVCGDDQSLFNAVTGLLLSDPADVAPGTPPELFLVGRTGMDGVTCGCVVHDRRLSAEPPMAMFSPMELRADYLGVDTRRSLGVLIGLSLAQLPAGDSRESSVRSVAVAMGFDPDELPIEPPLGVRPRTPPGWRLAMSADGLGVAAEARWFEPSQLYDEDPEDFEPPDARRCAAAAQKALNEGFPATALWHLRNGFTFLTPDGWPGEIVEIMRETYGQLGRTELITRLDLAAAVHRER